MGVADVSRGTHQVGGGALGESDGGEAVSADGQEGDDDVDERDPVREVRPGKKRRFTQLSQRSLWMVSQSAHETKHTTCCHTPL